MYNMHYWFNYFSHSFRGTAILGGFYNTQCVHPIAQCKPVSNMHEPTDRFLQVFYKSSPSQTGGVSRLSLSSIFILPLVVD